MVRCLAEPRSVRRHRIQVRDAAQEAAQNVVVEILVYEQPDEHALCAVGLILRVIAVPSGGRVTARAAPRSPPGIAARLRFAAGRRPPPLLDAANTPRPSPCD